MTACKMIIPWLIVPSQLSRISTHASLDISILFDAYSTGDARARWSLHLRRVGNIHTTPLPDQHIYQSQTSDPRKSTLGPTNRSRFRHIVVQDVQAQHFRFFCLGHLTTRQAQNVWYLGYEKIPLFIRSAQGRGSYASSPICGMRVNT